MRKIKKKTTSKYFNEILKGKKNFDVRLADWDCKEGDLLMLQEWDHKLGKYTGRTLEKKISFVLKTKNLKFFSKKDIDIHGYQIIGFK